MIDRERFRDALAGWASGVTVIAYRTDERVVATTVSAFTSLSAAPPLVLIALGPNATVRPFLQAGRRFTVNILAAEQHRLATIYADPFPVGPDPFPPSGEPVIAGALASLQCTVERVEEGGDHAVVIAAVDSAAWRDGAPLIRYRRKYHTLDG
ncbi:MAG TPA: flavin reductase family protein [Longimicrobiales bacterium]